MTPANQISSFNLRILSHPLTLSAIVVLMANDRLFKGLSPSALTGKLSDFAGLFFFPFLLAFFLGLLLKGRRFTTHKVMALAFGLTVLGFALVKLSPVANRLAVAALEGLLPAPVSILIDPTDLVALVVLLPAWRLWRVLESQPVRRPPARLAYVALGLASLAAIATSCPPQLRVVRLVPDGSSLYAGLDYYDENYAPFAAARSDDGGRTWTGVEQSQVPSQVALQLEEKPASEVSACDPADSQVCYRLSPGGMVEVSQDAGAAYQQAWAVPKSRKEFMQAVMDRSILAPCKPGIDTEVYDLAFVRTPAGTETVFAMGNEGVLVHTGEGRWERHGVLAAAPTPWSVDLVGLPFFLMLEEGLFLLLVIAAWLGYSALSWRVLLNEASRDGLTGQVEDPARWAQRPALLSAGLALAGIGIGIGLFALSPDQVWSLCLLPIAAIFLLVGPIISWRRVQQVSVDPQKARRAGRVAASAALLLFLAWLPFLLWAVGLIPFYAVAVGLAAFLGAALFFWGLRRTLRASQEAAASPV